MMSKRVFTVTAAPLLALALTGCDFEEWGADSQRYKEDFQFTEKLTPGGRLSLETLNGSVEIVGWDRAEAEITGTKYASSDQLLRGMAVDIINSGNALRIRTVVPSGLRGGKGARYVIRVPYKTELDRIISSNGSVRVEGIEGYTRLRTSNASIKAFGLKGTLEGETSNGSIELERHSGPASVQTSNAHISADDVIGYLDATTSNGSITARLSRPEPNRPVKLTTSNASITLTMDQVNGNDVRAHSSNGGITLRLPADLSAQLKATTSNGSVSLDFEDRFRGDKSKGHVQGSVGGGGPTIDVSTSNSSIRIERL
jgi:hypothetical protein